MAEEALRSPDQGEKPAVPVVEKETPVQDPVATPEAPEAPEAPPEKKEPPKTKVELSAADGSEVHLAQLGLLNASSAVKQIQLEIANLEGKVNHLREKLSWEGQKLEVERQKVLGVLSKHEIPDGWRFNREKDGSYIFFRPPPPPLPQAPPKRMG